MVSGARPLQALVRRDLPGRHEFMGRNFPWLPPFVVLVSQKRAEFRPVERPVQPDLCERACRRDLNGGRAKALGTGRRWIASASVVASMRSRGASSRPSRQSEYSRPRTSRSTKNVVPPSRNMPASTTATGGTSPSAAAESISRPKTTRTMAAERRSQRRLANCGGRTPNIRVSLSLVTWSTCA